MGADDEADSSPSEFFTQPSYRTINFEGRDENGDLYYKQEAFMVELDDEDVKFHIINRIYVDGSGVDNVIRSGKRSVMQRTSRPDRNQIGYYPHQDIGLEQLDLKLPNGEIHKRLVLIESIPQLKPLFLLEWTEGQRRLIPARPESIEQFCEIFE
jgi:hypothetical protein